MQTVEQTQQLSKELMLTPIAQVLDQVPLDTSPPPLKLNHAIKESLDSMFPEQQYSDKQLKQAKSILGKLANKFTPSQLKDVVTEIQFLVDNWLDEYERDVFEGLTLNELLHERGGE